MLRELFYMLLPYRSYAFPLLVASAIAIPCWVAFRLYRRRASAHRVSFGREILFLTFALYLVGLATATLLPNRSSRLRAEGRGGIDLRPSLASLTCASASMAAGSTSRGFCMHNVRANVALFFPLGFLLPLVRRRLRFWKGLQIAVAVSFSIEMLQYLSSALGFYRAADVNDFILNVFGAFLGLAFVFLLRWRPGSPPAVARV